jgi:hypothetical protein
MGQIGEDELLRACRAGSVAGGGGERRAVAAAVLRRCCHELKDQVDPRGLRLTGAAVVGQLDLAGLDVPFPLRFHDCDFDTAPVVEGAELFGLALTGCRRLPGLLGNGVRVRRDLDLSGSVVAGAHRTSASTSQTSAIWLCESVIGGRLLCVDTVIDGAGGRAVQADRMHVGGNIRLLHQFAARGQLRLIGAHIDGSLDMVGAHVECPAGTALDLAEAVIEGTVFLISDQTGRRPVIRGRIDMGLTRISGQLLIRDAIVEDRGAAANDRGYSRSTAHGCALNAPGLSVGAEVALEGRCEVTGAVDLSMSELSGLTVGGQCVLSAPGRSALKLINAQLRGDLRVDDGARVAGTVRLAGAVIHGMLALHGSITGPERRSAVGATALVVDGDVDLAGLRTAGGRVNFRGATLGSVAADGAQLDNPGGYTLSLNQATVKGSVRLANGFDSAGLLVLNRATIEGRLQCTGGSFRCPEPTALNGHGHAIEAISATVRGGIDLGWTAVWPSVDFTDATTTFLADDPGAWPPRFVISGLTYERFERPQGAGQERVWDQAARCAWLGGQSPFDSGPYEQAARVFRQHGYTSEAEEILMAQRRGAREVGRSGRARLRRALDAVYGVTVGYGYRPWRVLWALTALLVLVAVSLAIPASQATLRATDGNGDVYTTRGLLRTSAGPVPAGPVTSRSARVDSCGDGDVRCFSPVLYAIDTVIPLISLDQRSTWYPDPHAPGGTLMLWWLNIATLLGWLLSSIFALSFARLARSA